MRPIGGAEELKMRRPMRSRFTISAVVTTIVLPAGVADGRHKVLKILFILQATMIENIVANLAPENFLRGKWFCEKDRICISNDVLESVRIRQSESLRQV